MSGSVDHEGDDERLGVTAVNVNVLRKLRNHGRAGRSRNPRQVCRLAQMRPGTGVKFLDEFGVMSLNKGGNAGTAGVIGGVLCRGGCCADGQGERVAQMAGIAPRQRADQNQQTKTRKKQTRPS